MADGFYLHEVVTIEVSGKRFLEDLALYVRYIHTLGVINFTLKGW